MSDEICFWQVERLSQAFRQRKLSPVELMTAVLSRISRLDPELKSFIEVTEESAIRDARAAEAEIANGDIRGVLHGIPYSVKDLIDAEGVTTTGSSRVMRSNVAEADADLVRRLRIEGAILIGKNTAYEFGLGLPREGDWPPAARNPWDLDRIPGGSSSGSAVAVLAGLSSGSFGTDTGGSIRGPAAYCGVVGIKPSYGLISTEGVMPLSHTLDHVGPLARTVSDATAWLNGASKSRNVTLVDIDIDRFTLGVPRALIETATLADDVASSFEEALQLLRAEGIKLVDVDLPDNDRSEEALLTIIGREGYANHERYLNDSPDLYGESARERLERGIGYTEEDYQKAIATMEDAASLMASTFDSVDAIVSPVTHVTAATFATYAVTPTPRTLFTGIYNLVGAPAVSIPSDVDSSGMPIGFQVAGPANSDGTVLSLAQYIESAFEFATKHSTPFRPQTL